MNARLHTSLALAALGLAAAALAPGARACDVGAMPAVLDPAAALPVAMSAGAAPGADAADAAQRGKYFNPMRKLEPITGLYRFTFTVQGKLADQGFVTWHADGTEIMNSGRPPLTQSFCMGAWKQTGAHTYALNHWAMSWDPSGKTYIGPTNIRESITLAGDGNSYTGDFTLTQYTPDGKQPAGPTVMGSVNATRVTADGN